MYIPDKKDIKEAQNLLSPIIKVILWIVVIILAFPLYRYIMNQLAKNQVAADKNDKIQKYLSLQDPATKQAIANKITTRKDVQTASTQLAHHLGTKYSDNPLSDWWSWLYPSGWTENDGEVCKILINQQKNYSYLQKLYNQVDTNSRDLSTDILNLLDSSELKKVTKVIKL